MNETLATPNALGEEVTRAISEVLNPIIADAFALYIKTKNFHWHASGPNFREYHLLFDEQSEQVFAVIDVLAERVRKLGGLTIRSVEHIKSLQHIKDEVEPYLQPRDMLKRLIEDNKNFTAHLRAAHAICDEHGDVATASELEHYIDEAERRVWFLFESMVE